MTPANIDSAIGWTGGAGLLALFGSMAVRFLMKTFRTDRLEAASSGAEVGSYARLQIEIERLSNKCEELESRLNRLRDMELEDVADIATLTVLVSQMPCSRCTEPSSIYTQAKEVLIKMNARKRETHVVISGTKQD